MAHPNSGDSFIATSVTESSKGDACLLSLQQLVVLRVIKEWGLERPWQYQKGHLMKLLRKAAGLD